MKKLKLTPKWPFVLQTLPSGKLLSWKLMKTDHLNLAVVYSHLYVKHLWTKLDNSKIKLMMHSIHNAWYTAEVDRAAKLSLRMPIYEVDEMCCLGTDCLELQHICTQSDLLKSLDLTLMTLDTLVQLASVGHSGRVSFLFLLTMWQVWPLQPNKYLYLIFGWLDWEQSAELVKWNIIQGRKRHSPKPLIPLE